MNKKHFSEKPIKAVASINYLKERILLWHLKLLTSIPPIALSSPLLKNGFHKITYLHLMSLETSLTTSQLANKQKHDKN